MRRIIQQRLSLGYAHNPIQNMIKDKGMSFQLIKGTKGEVVGLNPIKF